MRNAARVNNNQIGLVLRGLNGTEPKLFEQLANLLAFVLIDFAAEGIHSEA